MVSSRQSRLAVYLGYMGILAQHKRASYDYEFLERFTAGVVLSGPEVKAAKGGQANLSGSFVVLRHHGKKPPEAYLINAYIGQYKYSKQKDDYDTKQARKLLLRRSEISRLVGKQQEKGLTFVPIRLYTDRSLVKLEFAVARGKKRFDKRRSIKERELKRRLQTISRSGPKRVRSK